MFPEQTLTTKEMMNSQQELKNIYEDNVDPRNVTGYSQIKNEIEKN